MRINCPFCGARGLEEYSYLGDATVSRPRNGEKAAWTDYVYLRDNPDGLHRELWHHVGGCHAWLVVTRNLRDHSITNSEFARDVALMRSGRD